MTIYRGPGGSGDATNDATVTAVAAYAAQAATSATNAANSATTSGTSATNSANSASSAAASASAAATSASQAASSQSDAATSATTAANSATEAGTQATNATTQANNAANSATAAATSASTATTKAAEAETYAIRAETAETNAETAYANTLAIYGDTTDVANAVASANTAASNAATSASQAAASANDASDEATQAGIYAGQAASSASAAANSAANSQAAVGDALALYGSAAALQTAVTNAQTSATQSANSATASSASSSAAQTSANAAATSATNAANSATQAANSAASAAAIVTGVASNRPSIRPSLLLDFQYTKQLDPRITFSRPTTATYYDGKTVVKAEENLLTYSQDFDTQTNGWSRNNSSVTANATTAPDGTATADFIVENTSNSAHGLYVSKTLTTGPSYVWSIYAKAGTRSWVILNAQDGTDRRTWFDLINGVVGTTAYGVTATISSVGNGWYRCTVSKSAAGTAGYFEVLVSTADNTTTYTGDGTSGIYIWGAQLEQRSTVTAYTPTTTSPITNYIPALQTAVSNDARFDHDPVTGESKGLLIEEQRTNLLTYSEQFDNAAWSKIQASITANTNIAPDGTLTADTITADSSFPNAGYQYGVVSRSSPTSGTYTLSVYAKSGTSNTLRLAAANNGRGTGADINLSTGVVGNNFNLPYGADANITSVVVTATAVGNGWYRCAIKWVAGDNWTLPTLGCPDTSKTLFIWGAQLEAGSFPTSYIPTVASQVTRSADSASMTGSNFSSWYRADAGSLYSEASTFNAAGPYTPCGFNDGTTANMLFTQFYLSKINSIARQGASEVARMDSSAVVSNTFYKSAFAFAANDFATSTSGAAVVTDTSGNMPTGINIFDIGTNYASGTQKLNGTIKRIAYYPKRLSNTELQGLTS